MQKQEIALQSFLNKKGAFVEPFFSHLQNEIDTFQNQGLYKEERIITTPQGGYIGLSTNQKVLNLCANNYLGLANDPRLIEATKKGLDLYGFGLASVRFICGTQTVHIELEKMIADFLGKESAILFSSCFDANGAFFEALLGPEDAIFSDSLNHASIIDGIRLCKAKRYRYQNNAMTDLENQLNADTQSRFKMIATDGVFSMDGIIANLQGIVKVAKKKSALIMVDDCHATGFLGKSGKGTHEYCGVMDEINFLTGTLGKALGGGSGGYIAGKKVAIDYLRQKARPYLFSNTLCPSLAMSSLKVFEILKEEGEDLIKKLFENTHYFRSEMQNLGFTLEGKDHPIIPVMIGDAKITKTFADKLLEEGIYVIGFSYPVVPQNKARIRTQISALHTKKDLIQAIDAFRKIGRSLKIIKN